MSLKIKAINGAIFLATAIALSSCTSNQSKKNKAEGFQVKRAVRDTTFNGSYAFPHSKYQVFAVLEDLVARSSILRKQINWNEARLGYEIFLAKDSVILYDLYFPGDDKVYLQNSDSAVIVLRDISLLVSETKFGKVTQDLSNYDQRKYVKVFDSLLIEPAKNILKEMPQYRITQLSQMNDGACDYTFEIRKTSTLVDTVCLVQFRGRHRIASEIKSQNEFFRRK